MSAPAVDATLPDTEAGRASSGRRALGLVVFLALLAVAVLVSFMFGSNPLPLGDVLRVLWDTPLKGLLLVSELSDWQC